jgi:DNA modification methylase
MLIIVLNIFTHFPELNTRCNFLYPIRMATLLLGDCLTHMKTLPDKSVNCFICDLPYGQLSQGNTKQEGCGWDVKIDLVEFWKQVKRLCKDDHTPVLMFCNTKFGIELINSNPDWFRYDLVWNKERGISFLLANKQPMRSHEMIYVFSKKGAYYNRVDVKTDKGEWTVSDFSKNRQYGVKRHKETSGGKDGMRCVLSVISESYLVRGGHPTEKPPALYKWLLERYCPAGGTVLDPTAGSFNSIQVAKELGLKGIGIEKDTDFFWKAMSRFAVK